MPNGGIVSFGGWKFILRLAPAVLFWALLVGWLAYALYDQTRFGKRSDESNMHEWLDEARVFRKSLPELARDYAAEVTRNRARDPNDSNASDLSSRVQEIQDQMSALVDPTRIYQTQLPLFAEIYHLSIHFADNSIDSIQWQSPVPRPRQDGQVRRLDHAIVDRDRTIGTIHCEYRLHAFTKTRKDEEERARTRWYVGGLLVVAGVIALAWLNWARMRERRIEHEKELAQVKLLEEQVRAAEAEHRRDELDRQLLEQSLEVAAQEKRAADAERSALELKSQLYASIGIMAGSYAHNIKNLLVRPNDLLSRCLEADGLSSPQETMLREVRSTLGTVTERLQQILRTVRRDPSRSEMTRIDLAEVARDTLHTWQEMAREKWKLVLSADIPNESLWVLGDLSHLQQAIENLVFNARDATFEMRNHLRDQARENPNLSPESRRQAVLAAAGWKGEVKLRVRPEADRVILEVRDNGIGMTEEVRRQCTQTHFTTKRDNALYEGLSAGMGLGLSFVAVVLEHHEANLEIVSQPLNGATFRLSFPMATP